MIGLCPPRPVTRALYDIRHASRMSAEQWAASLGVTVGRVHDIELGAAPLAAARRYVRSVLRVHKASVDGLCRATVEGWLDEQVRK